MSETILYATLSVIVLVVLYSVLGRQIGRGPGDDDNSNLFDTKPRDGSAVVPAKVVAESNVVDLASGTPVAPAPVLPGALSDILARDPAMRPSGFVDQATTAYSMVLEAFAEGDRDTLSMLLTERMSGIYSDAIADRERQDLVQETDIVRVGKAEIVDARLDGKAAEIDVRFESELSSALVDKVGQPVVGDPDLIASVNEVWTFSRVMGTDDPAWRLSDVAPEQGDALPADPAPDTNI